MEWTEETVTRLRAFWDEGHSTAEIGRRLGITKNAVVGKAHRLKLPPRPSPIRHASLNGAPPRRPSPYRVSGPTLPKVAVVTSSVPNHAELAQARPMLRAVAATARTAGRLTACCWPIGEPGTPSFRFCTDPALTSKPYCAEHASIAYVRVRDRRADAA